MRARQTIAPVLLAVFIVITGLTWHFHRGDSVHIEHFNGSSGGLFSVVRVDIHRRPIEIMARRADGSLYRDLTAVDDGVAGRNRHLLLAMNAGIFSEKLSPVGLLVAGRQLLAPLNDSDGDGNFFLKPNGVFFIDENRARMLETSEYRRLIGSNVPEEATQSGPMLVIDGAIHPKFDPRSTNRTIRNAIGVDRAGNVCCVISDEPVTFYEIASLFRDQLDCPNALYLDGAISRMNVPGQRDEDGGPFAAMLVVRSQ